jgi:hypothetical protein
MENRIKLGVSACLLGENVRYDGGHKLDRFIRDTLGGYVDFFPVCPEVDFMPKSSWTTFRCCPRKKKAASMTLG